MKVWSGVRPEIEPKNERELILPQENDVASSVCRIKCDFKSFSSIKSKIKSFLTLIIQIKSKLGF